MAQSPWGGYCGAPGTQIAVGPPAPMQVKPPVQSVFAVQGNAQRPVVMLHLCVPQMRSFWQGRASGLAGVVAVAVGAGYWPAPGCPGCV